jgi:hypothetical protein
MTKILGIGLSKTGTTSLAQALNLLGFRCLHDPPAWQLATADGLVDTPAAARYRELDVMYPGSKFILTTRERDAWLQSCRKHWERVCLHLHTPESQFEYMWCRTKLFGRLDFDADNHWQAYQHHVADVRDYFAARPDDLLELDVTAAAGWPPLCQFLKVPVPAVPFPWHNKTSEKQPRAAA